MNFASDNAAGVAPAILEAVGAANDGFALAYGDDDVTQRVERRFCEVFEREVAVFLVPTGTAANALALAHLTPVWGAVMCHCEAHIIANECGAPEFFGGGLRLVGLAGEGGKLAPATLAVALDRHEGHSPHQVVPAMVSLTQATEAGTIYRTPEVAALCALAHERGLTVHMDGARFGNAIARLGVTPAQATWQAGVDVLAFGATKGGALAAEAVVFFDPALAAGMAERRKRGAHLVSKHRFIAAQFEAFFAGDLWLSAGAPRQPHGRSAGGGTRGAGPRAGMAGRGKSRLRAVAASPAPASAGGGRPVLRVPLRQPAGAGGNSRGITCLPAWLRRLPPPRATSRPSWPTQNERYRAQASPESNVGIGLLQGAGGVAESMRLVQIWI